MNAIDIRDYSGDFEDVSELTRRVWTSAYSARMWFPLWDAGFLRWQAGGHEHSLIPAAYDGAKLIGSFFSIPHTLRVGRAVLSIGLASWCTVDPEYRSRRPALRLIEALRKRHDDLGLAFSLGVISGNTASIAHQFWTRYARAYPQNIRMLFRFGMWIKILAPERVAQAGVKAWERLAIRSVGPLLRGGQLIRTPNVRAYRAEDLSQCEQLLASATDRFEWALLWPPARLANQLESNASGTFVLDSEGQLRGMVNYHCLWFLGREPVRAALIDLWADQNLQHLERVRLLRHLCHDLRERGFHLVLALRSAMMPTFAFAANGFFPQRAHDRFVVLFPRKDIALPTPKTWSLVMR